MEVSHLYLMSLVKKDYTQIKSFPMIASCISFAMYVALSIIFIILRFQLPLIITNDYAVIEKTSSLIILAVLTHVFISPSIIYRNALFSVGESKFILVATAISNAVAIVLMLFLVYHMQYGLQAILLINLINALILLIIFYKKYKGVLYLQSN